MKEYNDTWFFIEEKPEAQEEEEPAEVEEPAEEEEPAESEYDSDYEKPLHTYGKANMRWQAEHCATVVNPRDDAEF